MYNIECHRAQPSQQHLQREMDRLEPSPPTEVQPDDVAGWPGCAVQRMNCRGFPTTPPKLAGEFPSICRPENRISYLGRLYLSSICVFHLGNIHLVSLLNLHYWPKWTGSAEEASDVHPEPSPLSPLGLNLINKHTSPPPCTLHFFQRDNLPYHLH